VKKIPALCDCKRFDPFCGGARLGKQRRLGAAKWIKPRGELNPRCCCSMGIESLGRVRLGKPRRARRRSGFAAPRAEGGRYAGSAAFPPPEALQPDGRAARRGDSPTRSAKQPASGRTAASALLERRWERHGERRRGIDGWGAQGPSGSVGRRVRPTVGRQCLDADHLALAAKRTQRQRARRQRG